MKVLTRIGELSFAIYLVHPLWLFLYREYDLKLNPVTDDYLIWIYGGMVTALIVSALVVQTVFRWIQAPGSLLGGVPRSLKPSSKAPKSPSQRKDTVAGDSKKSVDL